MMTYSPLRSIYYRSVYHSETMTICHNLKHLKDISGLSYRKLSLDLGFGPKTLVNYISGYVRPNRERLDTIVSYFGVDSVEDLCMDESKFKHKYQTMKGRGLN